MRRLMVKSENSGDILRRLEGNLILAPPCGRTRYEVIAIREGHHYPTYELYEEVNIQCESCIHSDVCKYISKHQQETDAVCGYHIPHE